jgi:hypothetical protein
MQPSNRFMTAVAALIVAAGSLAAQSATSADRQPAMQSAATTPVDAQPVAAAPVNDAAAITPFAENAPVGIHVQLATAPAPYVPMRRDEPVGHNTMLMIVGGAILVTGAIIAGSASSSGARTVGDVAMIGGAVVGIIGLVRYLH